MKAAAGSGRVDSYSRFGRTNCHSCFFSGGRIADGPCTYYYFGPHTLGTHDYIGGSFRERKKLGQFG